MPQQSVLLIDQNPAVQAITSLALSHLGINVKTLASAKTAWETIVQIKPDLVLCAHQLRDADPKELARKIKSGSDTKQIGFVMLAPADAVQSLTDSSAEHTIDAVLVKPFKSEQLRNIVQSVLSRTVQVDDHQPRFLLYATDPLLQKIFKRIFKHRQSPWTLCEDIATVMSSANQAQYDAVIVEYCDGLVLDWYNEAQMGELVVITPQGVTPEAPASSKHMHVVSRPLSMEKLTQALQHFMPAREPEALPPESSNLSSGAHAALAARISAHIFEQLLGGPALQQHDWEAAGELAKKAVLATCKDFSERE